MMMTSVSKPHPRTLQAYLFFFLFLLLSYTLSRCDGGRISVATCLEIEKQSLLSFKHSLQDPFNMLSSWNATDCCEWKGVVCSNLTSHVVELHLQGSLSGKIMNPSLLDLKHMKYLDLSQNNLETILPSFIGSLTSLEYLNLSYTGIYGKIPTSIGNLSNLHTLSLGHSYGSLNVDSLDWLSGLSKLKHLNMNHVNLGNATDWSDQVFNKLHCLVDLHLNSCSLVKFEVHISNISQSSLAVVDLSGNNFESCAILGQIFRLNNLLYLDLSLNSFHGPIPTVSNTSKLQHVNLSNNNFNSTIPDWLHSCKHLEFVNLGYNNLQGEISNSIANLTSLVSLNLAVNELSGKIPKEITRLCKLQRLKLSGNTLEGDISDLFGNMSGCFVDGIEYLMLRDNRLSGHLVDHLGGLKSLKVLSVIRNKLTGNLPQSLGRLSQLKHLLIGHNLLEGVVSESHFSNLTRLALFYAEGNKLSLRVSSNWIPPFQLEGLRLGSWDLGSHIPSWLETQKMSLKELDLANTGISATVPTWFWEVPHLILSDNQLHGSIPDITSARSRVLRLRSNYFSGPLPRVAAAKTLKMLDFSDNLFSGSVFHFFCEMKTNSSGLQILDLSGNLLSGGLPDCLMKWPSLVLLELGDNNISGSIPNSVGHLAELRSLYLYNNNFSGHLPLSMSGCIKLVTIDLSYNSIAGSVSTLMGLPNLRILTLSSNKFRGEISRDICNLTSLQVLDLSDNMLSGEIPNCFHKLTAMATKRTLSDGIGELRNQLIKGIYFIIDTGDASLLGSDSFQMTESVTTKGRRFRYRSILSLVTSINLSNNNLSGDVSNDITSLVELRSLNLSGNHFTGSIPFNMGNMKQLESLDFSRNSLSGEIPNSFTVMSSLNYLNLSCNNLTGRIPESTQLLGFTRSSFNGNNLCGPQLMISCTTSHYQEAGSLSEIDTFYVFLSSGYAVGLSAFLTALLLKKTWRENLHEFSEKVWDNVYVYFYVKWRRLTQG